MWRIWPTGPKAPKDEHKENDTCCSHLTAGSRGILCRSAAGEGAREGCVSSKYYALAVFCRTRGGSVSVVEISQVTRNRKTRVRGMRSKFGVLNAVQGTDKYYVVNFVAQGGPEVYSQTRESTC